MADCEKVMILQWAESPPIPQGTKPLAHQVAGHVFGRDNGHKKNKIGFLQSDDGYILKPVLGPTKGLREVEFYRKVHDPDCTDDVLLGLRQFMPGYVGVWSTPEHPGHIICKQQDQRLDRKLDDVVYGGNDSFSHVNYLKLEDVTSKFQRPCIMDIKVGPITYDMEADADKIRREKSKFPALEEVGFQVVGIKVYSPVTNSYKTVERTFLRALDKTTILTKGISQYFTVEDSLELDLVQAFLRRLCKIEAWFLAQRKYTFIASSLLFIYDGKALHDYKLSKKSQGTATINNFRPDLSENSAEATKWISNKAAAESDGVEFFDSVVDVHMIDFTHVFTVDDTRDENYLVGLQSIIRYLKELMNGKLVLPQSCS